MAKVTIIFEDTEDDRVEVKMQSDPPAASLEELTNNATPAQLMAVTAIATLVQEHQPYGGVEVKGHE